MSLPSGIVLFLCPRVGSTLAGNGLLIAGEGEAIRLHVFHSRENAVRLLERYGPITDPRLLPPWRDLVAASAIPEVSAEEDVCIEGNLVVEIFQAFYATLDTEGWAYALVADTPRILMFLRSGDGREALCVWKDMQGYHAARLTSRRDIMTLNLELASFLSVQKRRRLNDTMREAGTPLASASPILRFHGPAAALIGNAFEMNQRRRRGS